MKKTYFSEFPNWSDINRAVQPNIMASGLKFRMQAVKGLCYLCSENKGADELRLCFLIYKIMFSHDAAHMIYCLGDKRLDQLT